MLKRVAVDTGDTGEHNCECAAIVIIGSGIIPVEKQGEGATKLYLRGERPGFCDYLLYLLIIASAIKIKNTSCDHVIQDKKKFHSDCQRMRMLDC